MASHLLIQVGNRKAPVDKVATKCFQIELAEPPSRSIVCDLILSHRDVAYQEKLDSISHSDV